MAHTAPPPPDWDSLQEPPDLDFSMPDDPFPDDLFSSAPDAYDYLPEDDPFEPTPTGEQPSVGAALSSVGDEDGWAWHDAALIAVERADENGAVTGYSIGAVDLYANANTGDIGGSYLEIGTFQDIDAAAGFYHRLQGAVHDRQVLPFQLVDFAEEQARERADELGVTVPAWGAAGPAEYAAYEETRSLDSIAGPDLPSNEFDLDDLFGLDSEPGQTVETDTATFKALREIGIAADGFDPDSDPPPFVDPETGTAYWIGVFQPDRNDPDNAVTSILSLGRDPETGEVEAQLAPIVPGEWDKAYGAAEYLLGVVEKGGIERAFEAAEGMALASDQRELWERERGIPLEPDAAQDLADYTRDQWEIDL